MIRCDFLFILVFGLAAFVPSAFGQPSSGYQDEVEKWRADHQKELLSDDGWFTVAGLFWLREGGNTVGSGDGYDVQLTPSFKQGKFGEIDFSNGKATLHVADGVEALIGSKKIASIGLGPGAQGKPTIVQAGSQSFFLIEREGRHAIRLKDKNNPARTNFHGLKWYDIDSGYHIIASFEAFAVPREVLIPNVLGGNFKMKSPGLLHFALAGRSYTLQPVEDEDKLFIIFRDATSKTETYPAGRFLYADKAINGKVVLDFNQAENPPCAFTGFATCPLSPPQNRLDIEIKAGEKRYHD